MAKIFIFLILSSYVMATNLLTYNIYDRSDRIDLMLSFDSPYNGQISQEKKNQATILKLSDLSYNKLIKKDINSNIVQNLTIKPSQNFIKIIIKSKNKVGIIASKTTDGFGLRVRIKTINVKPKQKSTLNSIYKSNSSDKAMYKNESTLDARYIIVVAILFFMIIFMFWIKKRVRDGGLSKPKDSWLFKKSDTNQQNIRILHKKQIDANNSVILLEFNDRKYLVMSGASNILLDSFGEKEAGSKSEFEKAFEDNRKKLDDYLKLQDQKLENYKEKASSDFHKEFEFYK